MSERCLLLYITDRKAFAQDEPTRRRCVLEKIAEAARAGIDYIQLREKDLSTTELTSLAHEAATLLEQLGTENGERTTALLVNSRTDVALASGADGVHLRSDDISATDVHTIWRTCALNRREKVVIGISCHSSDDVKRAEADGATFAVFAPVFEKKDAPGSPPAGLTELREACTSKIPVLALGGVSIGNTKSCLDAGAAGIAAIRLFQDNDMAHIVASLRELVR